MRFHRKRKWCIRNMTQGQRGNYKTDCFNSKHQRRERARARGKFHDRTVARSIFAVGFEQGIARHAVHANNHREINTRKHIGVKDTHATSNSCNKQERGSYNQMEEDKIMHGLKYNYSKSTTSAGRITRDRGGCPPRNGPSTPLSMIPLPPPPQILSLSPSLSLFSSI